MANLILTNQGEYLFGDFTSYSYGEEAFGNIEKTDICRIGSGTLSRLIPICNLQKFESITDLTVARNLMAPFYVIDCDEVIN